MGESVGCPKADASYIGSRVAGRKACLDARPQESPRASAAEYPAPTRVSPAPQGNKELLSLRRPNRAEARS